MSQIDPLSPATSSRSLTMRLNTPHALALARVLVPLCFGLYSLWLGADSNWDLYNYHMYNPFAWLHGKLRLDIAPAGMQSYFNPLLDTLLYLGYTHLPSRVMGFLMGTLHGLSFVLVLGIVQSVLPDLPDRDRYRVPLLLALAGCVTANFLSGLGSSMGDDTTALFGLASVLILVSGWARLGLWRWSSIGIAIAAGIAVGLSVGLKLTNAVFAVALCAALLSYPGSAVVRLRLAFLFGVGVLLGFAATGAYWPWQMWKTFGNPLYPQFGNLFPTPLVQPNAMGDPRWLPHGWLETVLWPFIFTLHSQRVGETPIRQIIWPVVYVLFWLWVALSAIRTITGRKVAALAPRARFIVVFVALGYLVWMKGFSIYRYIVVIEMLTPLVAWILLHQLLPASTARRLAIWILVIASGVVVTGGARTWGHEGWADPLWHAQTPTIADPQRTTVVLASTQGKGLAWLATLFPDQVAFMQLDSSFPGTPAFRESMREVARQRGGPINAIIDGDYNWRIDSVTTFNGIVDGLRLTHSEGGCNALRWTLGRLRLHASVMPATGGDKRCELGLRADDVRDPVAANRADAQAAVPVFERNGFTLDPSTCVPYRAGIGTGVVVYQWCSVSLRTGQ
ncbi:hypothetical protein M3I53_34915 [Paraburkholderia sp. CNPSo 3272]|uniref:hypothetical protein n=1 Tax=Paraburkholderia sp. CNPSo 3272 TaxID=2940931 RepID=UPI0020B875C7|nr:hypothetical protein [Paraburkholderia sp. CNPSo 3272]MCP3728242.1 hypothetical protein [Paraburkholderia sp. CNPSo 3272]